MRQLIAILVTLLLCPNISKGQNFQIQKTNSSIVVSGTSSLHDWDVNAEDFSGSIEFDEANDLKISKLSLNVVSESLKSGKGGMDKNIYKALNTNKYKSITFKLTEIISCVQNDKTNYTVDCLGTLTISGNSQKIKLKFLLTKLSNGVTVTGSKSIKMTDFGIDPPKALFGTITTGDEIKINFKSVFKSNK